MKRILAAVALLGVAVPVCAEDLVEICAAGGPCRTASANELNELRGGFDMDIGGRRLRVDIGITREVSINNRVVATSQLTIPDIGRFMGPRGGGEPVPTVTTHTPFATQLANGPRISTDGQGGVIVQNGPGNHAPSLSQIGSQAMPVVVQNTLDNQSLKTLTTVTARVNSMQLLNDMRISDMMNAATARSGR